MKEAHPTTCFPIRNKKLNKFLLSSIITSKEVILRPTGQWTHVQQKASGMGKKTGLKKRHFLPIVISSADARALQSFACA